MDWQSHLIPLYLTVCELYRQELRVHVQRFAPHADLRIIRSPGRRCVAIERPTAKRLIRISRSPHRAFIDGEDSQDSPS